MEIKKNWSVFHKVSLAVLFLMPVAFVAVFWSARGGAQTQTADSLPIPTCSFSYSNWSDCNSSGIQTREITDKFPSGCYGGTPESLRQSCTYQAPACIFSYSPWSECDSSGHQNRVVKSTSPSGCTGSPETYRRCTYQAPICSFDYSAWGKCQSNGIQTRQITSKTPTDCSGGTPGELSRTCTYTPDTIINTTVKNSVACSYTYTDWSRCDSSGHQNRLVKSTSPTGCDGTPETYRRCVYQDAAPARVNDPDATASCSYRCSTWSICSPEGIRFQDCEPSPDSCPGETKTVTENCIPLKCKFSYSNWGRCVEGLQFRNILNATPENCVGGDPVLRQNCSTQDDKTIVPEQEKNVSTVSDPDVSVNDKWKKETFKTDACQEEICGGNADPDKDGLTNNDEFRYETDPLNPDTDRDGKTDGAEVAKGSNPLKSSAKGEEDEIIFENPKKAGIAKETIYQVTNVEMIGESKRLKLTGKGPSNSYVTVYVYSGQPVIVTVKTDSNGDWTYTIDKELEDGDHEVYVAVTNNSGAIKAKSNPLPFVKTAQAVTVVNASGGNAVQSVTGTGINFKSLLFILGLSFFGVAFAVIIIGLAMRRLNKKPN